MDRFEFVCGTDQGRVRSGNEDAVFGDGELGVAVLADGMGGYAAGEVASRLAVDEVRAELASALPHLMTLHPDALGAAVVEDMRFAAQRANTSIVKAATKEPSYEGMGSTLVIAVIAAGRLFVGHLGDSRAYRYRAGRLEQLTRDHCWVDEQIAEGNLQIDALLDARLKNIVTRALGIDDEVDLEVHDHEIASDDIYLLCSDGLTDMLTDAEIEDALALGADLDATVKQLIARANEHGGKDNISVILGRQVVKNEGWASRLVRRLQGGAPPDGATGGRGEAG